MCDIARKRRGNEKRLGRFNAHPKIHMCHLGMKEVPVWERIEPLIHSRNSDNSKPEEVRVRAAQTTPDFDEPLETGISEMVWHCDCLCIQ